MKKILIFENHYGKSYYDASTPELSSKAYLKEMTIRSPNMYRPNESESTFTICSQHVASFECTEQMYNDYKDDLEKLSDKNGLTYNFVKNIVNLYEQEKKNHIKSCSVFKIFDQMIKGERPKNAKGNQISYESVFREIFGDRVNLEHIIDVSE